MNIGTLTVTLMADLTQLDKMTSGLNSISQKFRTFGYLASTALTLPMVMAGKAAFQMAKDYEFSMQKIVGLTGVAQESVNKWSDQILKLGPQLGKTPQELADALYFISSSGIKGAEAMNVLALSAKSAEAGLGETKDVANVLTSALNAYRGTGLTAAYATDVLIAAVREGKAEAAGFVSAMGQIIPIAANLGVSFDQVAGGMAAITLTGSSAASAAVYLKGVFNTLLTANNQGTKALNSVGLSYAYLRKVLADGPNGLINVMQIFRDVQMTLGDEAVKDVLPNIRALTGYMSLAGKNFEYNTEVMKRVTNATGSLGVAWAAVATTIKVRFDQAISQANVSLISMGKSIATVLLPILEKWVQKLTDLTKWFDSLSEEQKRHKLVILAWVAAAGPLSLILSLIGYTITGLISIFVGFGKSVVYLVQVILALTGNIKALNAATATNAILTKGLMGILTSPWTAVAVLIIAATVAMRNYIKEMNNLSEADKALNLKDKQQKNIGTITGGLNSFSNDPTFGYKEIETKMALLHKMDITQLEEFKNSVATRIQLTRDENLKLLAVRKNGLSDDEYILGQQKIMQKANINAQQEYNLFITTLKKKGYNAPKDNNFDLSNPDLVNPGNKAWSRMITGNPQLNYIQQSYSLYKSQANGAAKAIASYKSELESKLNQNLNVLIPMTLKNLVSDMTKIEAEMKSVMGPMEIKAAYDERMKVQNAKVKEITGGISDELKYTDSLATVMKSLGIEYDVAAAKADIFLKAIEGLTKEGLPANSTEVQKIVEQYKKLREEMTASPLMKVKTDNLSVTDNWDAVQGKRKKGTVGNAPAWNNQKLAGAPNQDYAAAIIALGNFHDLSLMSERDFLKQKYALQLVGEKDAQKMILITYKYQRDLKKLQMDDILSYLNSASNAINSISTLIEASKQKELSAAGDNAKRRERIEKEYMQKQKGWAIAQAIINGALAVTNLIANVPLSVLNPATWVGIGVAAASTAAQVAIIAGQGMKTGGTVPSGYPNDTYPALLTSGETVTPPGKLENISRQGDNMPREVLIRFQNGSLEGYIDYQKRRVNSFA